MATLIHLDTNYMIACASGLDSVAIAQVDQWIIRDQKFCCCAMAWAEFLCGPVLHEEIAAMETLLDTVVPVTSELAAEGARLFRETGRRSRSLPDCIIAAAAMMNLAPLATLNRQDFTLFVPHGLELV